MALNPQVEPQFSQPVRQIVMMLIVLATTATVAVLIYPTIAQIFLASPWLKIFIVLVFIVGVIACFWQVITLIASVSWIEGFALDRPGNEFTKAPRLLAPLAAMLSERRARRALTSSSTRSILETVATRIEEQRDLTRYIISLLIFLGLLGTFYGLATVVPQWSRSTAS
jgi:protein-S-isoprenylcysteine O-methyltransferase Ste14